MITAELAHILFDCPPFALVTEVSLLAGLTCAVFYFWNRMKEAEKFIRRVAGAVPSMITVYDIERRRILHCSRQSEVVAGYDEAEMTAMSDLEFFELIHPDDREYVGSVRAAFEKNPRQGMGGIIYRLRHKQGHYIWLEGRITALKMYKDGRCQHAIIVNIDITAIKEAERESRRLTRLIDSSPDFFGCLDFSGRPTYLNGGARGIGWAIEPEITFANFLGDEGSVFRMKNEVMPKLLRGEAWTGRLQLKNLRDNSSFPSFVRMFPLRTDEGTPECVAVIATDASALTHAEEELATHKSRAELAVRGGRMGVFEWDIVTGECLWDDEMYSVYGQEPKRKIHIDDWWTFISPDNLEEVMSEINAAVCNEKPLNTKGKIIKGDGTVAWIRSIGYVIRDPSGKPVRMMGLNWDVTKEAVLAEELEKSKAYFETILDTVGNPVFVRDSNFRLIYCNRAYTELLGKTREDLLGDSEGEVWPQEIAEFGGGIGEGYEHEVTIMNAKQERRNLLTKRVRYRSSTGENLIVGSVSDITALKNLQEIALQNEKQLRTFIEQFPVAVAMFDRDLKCLAASHAWLMQNRLEWSPFIGQEFHRAMPLMPEKWNRAHHRALGGQVVRCFEDRAVGPEGEVQWLNWEVRPWYQAGSVGGFLVMIESVTERKMAFEEIERTRARQVESSRLLSIGQMAAGVAHEINNPLTVIMGKAWMVQEKIAKGDLSEESVTDAMKKIGQYSERIGKIVKALRDFSRDSSSDPMTIFSIEDILNDTFSMCGERFRHNNVELIVDTSVQNLDLKCRPSQITQILVNLLNNAYDAAKGSPRPWVKIDVKAVGSSVQIRVHDSGSGVPAGLESRIFEPFFTTKEIGKGTGLGLSICTGIVRDHGGTLSLDLTVSRSCFLLILPLNGASARGVA